MPREQGTVLASAPVYTPQEDTRLLMDALADLDLRGARVLDLCTGTGAVAVEAAARGAAVTAIDVSPAAVDAARAVSARAGARVDVQRADLARYRNAVPFDVITCNPPYVPTPVGTERLPRVAPALASAWNAGPDGRAVLDVVCARLDDLLAPSGIALLVQSAFAGVERTMETLRCNGFTATTVRRTTIPFGPVLRARRHRLRLAGVIPPGCRHEEIAVVTARRPERTR